MPVLITESDFNLGEEYQKCIERSPDTPGAVVQFIGLVRDFNQDSHVEHLVLEHYPGMTESVITDICHRAMQRWHISEPTVIHRVGALKPKDQIVLVSVTSAHRADAFSACEFIMDQLKTHATFWKKEKHRTNTKDSDNKDVADSEHWLEMKESDRQRAQRWDT